MAISKSDLPNQLSGAVMLEDCPSQNDWFRRGSCRCGTCRHCGFAKHTAIHGPLIGGSSGSKPFGHEFAPIIEEAR